MLDGRAGWKQLPPIQSFEASRIMPQQSDALHKIGRDAGPHQHPLLVVVGVPIVGGQLLVVPDQLAGLDVQRNRRVAVEIGGCGVRDGVRRTVARESRRQVDQ